MASSTQTTQNIKRSVQSFLDGLSWGVPVLFDAPLDKVPDNGAWVDVRWGKRNLTRMGSSETGVQWALFLDCWSRLKDDPLAGNLDALADKVLDSLRNGTRDTYITLNDYTDPANPVDTGFKIRLSIEGDDQVPSTDLVYGRSITVGVWYFERP